MKRDCHDYSFKTIILGNSAVGKSCLLQRYCNNKFTSTFTTTVGVDFQIKKLQIDGKQIKLSIWDTTGQEKWRNITLNYYKGAHGILLVYSVDDITSFQSVEYWIQSIKEKCDNPEASIILLGNKSDIQERVITQQQGAELAQKYKIPFYETSAMSSTNVNEVFTHLAKSCLQKYKEVRQQEVQLLKNPETDNGGNTESIKLSKGKLKKEKKESCC